LPPWPLDTVAGPGGVVAVRRAAGFSAEAEPAVFVHGLAGNATNWTDLMGLLRDRLDGVAIDLPGFGFSPPRDDGDYTPAGHARSVVGLIEAVRRGPVHLFGNSLGGAVAVRVAAERRDLVRSLTLISPALPDLRLRRFTAGFVPLAAPVLGERIARALASQDPRRRARQIAALCFADPSSIPPAALDLAAAELARRRRLTYANDALLASLRGLVADYLRQGRRSPWVQLLAIAAPTLVIVGGRDRLVHLRVIARAARSIPGSRLMVVPGSGHLAQMEHPELVDRAVRELLDEVSGPGASPGIPGQGGDGRHRQYGNADGHGTVEWGKPLRALRS
jgi:pimeloyl-ACP methyl ester carboxylesterase